MPLRRLCHPGVTRVGDTVLDPRLDVDPPVTDVSADSEPDGSFSSVAPCVEGLDWDVEEVGEFVCGEEKVVVVVHGRIMRVDPLTRVSATLSAECHFHVLFFRVSPAGRWCSRSRTLCLTCSWRVSDRVLDRVADTLVRGFEVAGRAAKCCSISPRSVGCRLEG